MSTEDLEFETSSDDLGIRLDQAICLRAPGISRSRVQLVIRNGLAEVDGKRAKASMLVKPGQRVSVALSQLESLRPELPRSEAIDLDILFEDDHIVVINKPPGMVVHPAKGHWSGTLVAGLMHRFENLSAMGGDHRPGIVHRLDRDTSGVIVVAKTDAAHTNLMRQFEKRTVNKLYLAICAPGPDRDRDRIEKPIGAHPYQREKMAIREQHPTSKRAETFYEVRERLGRFSLVEVKPKTGRTHQIRVHLAHIGCPVLADRLYAGRSSASEGFLRDGKDHGPKLLERQALHAAWIEFRHPQNGNTVSFKAPLPEDMQRVLNFLRDQHSPA